MDKHPTRVTEDDLLAHGAAILALARCLATDEHQAADLAQDTFLTALGRPAPSSGKLRAWLMGVTRNLARRVVRSESRRRARERAALAERCAPSPSDIVSRMELRQIVVAELLRLEEPFRATLLLRFFEGLEPIEIARRNGTPPGTVRSRLKEGLDRLRARLDKHHRGSRTAWIAPLVLLVHTHGPRTLASSTTPLASTTASAVTTGGFVMAWKVIGGVACVALLAGAWLLLRTVDADLALTAGRTREQAERTEALPVAPSDTDAASQSPPVNLQAADRDLDLHGRITTVDGEPVARAVLTLRKYPWRRTRVLNHDGDSAPVLAEQLTRTDGTYSFRLRRGSLVDLHVQASGFVSQTIPSAQAGERLDIALTKGGIDLTVEVLDEEGEALEGATVRVFTLSNEPAATVHHTGVTDADGRSRFPGIRPSLPLQTHAWKTGVSDSAWVAFTTPTSGTHTVTVRLPPGRILHGKITDAATGRPVAGAVIGKNRSQQDAVRSGPDGTWRLSGWTGATTREIAFTAEGYGRTHVTVGDREVIDVALEPGDTVVGRLVDSSGSPIVVAQVSAIARRRTETSSDFSFGHDVSDEEGRFRVTSLRHDMAHTLVIFAEGLGRTMIDISPHPEWPGVVDLGDVLVHAGHSIEGIVRDSNGVPVPCIAVTLVGANADRNRLRGQPSPDISFCESEHRRTDDIGRFRFPDLAPGTYTITAEPPRAPHGSTVVRILSTDVLDAAILLMRGRLVKVTVLGPDGTPLPKVMVVAGVTGSRPVSGRTGKRGTCELTIDSDRRVHLAAWSRGALPADLIPPPPQILKPDEIAATFQFSRGYLVRACVLDSAGEPVPGLQVEILTGAKRSLVAITDDEGRFAKKVPSADPVDLIVTGKVQLSVHPGRLPLRGEARGVRPNDREVTILCRNAVHDRILFVRVLDPDGKPIKGIHVWSWDSGLADPQCVTGADGRARLTGLPPEEARFSAYPASGQLRRGWFPPPPQQIIPDGQTVEMRFRRAVEVTGVLTDRDGAGIVAARVSARLGNDLLSSGTTEAGGHFTLRVPEGTRRFDITADWNSPETGVGRASVSGVTPDEDIRLIADR
jgi:RNA polymerase sigma factor (sigma-70 family)